MKQISLLPSGCQTWHRFVLGCGPSHFVYASTLATYAHRAGGGDGSNGDASYRLDKLQTAHERTITSLSFCAHSGPSAPSCSSSSYITSGADLRVIRWNILESGEQSSLTLSSMPLATDWAAHLPSQLDAPLAMLVKPGSVELWDPLGSGGGGGGASSRSGSGGSGGGKHHKPECLRELDASCIRWNGSSRAAMLAIGTNDGLVLLYDRATDKIVQRIDVASLVSPSSTSSSQSSSSTSTSSSSSSQPVPDPSSRKGEVIDLAWDPFSNQFLLVLFSSGFLVLLDADSGNVVQQFVQQSLNPSLVSFVPGQPGEFVTVNPIASTICVWSVGQSAPKEISQIQGLADGGSGGAEEEKKMCGILSIKAMHPASNTTAGAGASSNPGASVSFPSSLTAPPLPSSSSSSNSSSSSSANANASARFLIAFMDGSVGVYSFLHRRLLSLTSPAHAETIFDVRFQPSSRGLRMATASYDSSVKIWDTSSGARQVRELKGQGGVLYAVTWAPASIGFDCLAPSSSGEDTEQRLASAGSDGDVFIWSSSSGEVLSRCKHHTKPIYSLKWHPSDVNLLVSGSSDGLAIVFTPLGKVLRKLKHPAPVYGVDWSPFAAASGGAGGGAGMVATGCHDGKVRVFDLSRSGFGGGDGGNVKPTHELSGHTARVFNVAFSPLIPDRLASGSDDRSIRVWDLSTSSQTKTVVLQGHTHNIRGLAWSHEIPFVLLSGAWDGTIRIWDIRDGRCLSIISEHHADVYGLASHPARPFNFVSSSRDTSLRFWNLDLSSVNRIRLQAVLEAGLLQASHVGSVEQSMRAGGQARLCGSQSAHMVSSRASRQAPELERYARLFEYVSNTPGTRELWTLIDALVNNKPTSSSSTPSNLLALADVLPCALASARRVHASRSLSYVGLSSVSSRLRSAAASYLSLGLLREHCELLISPELNDWTQALSVAPGVSLSYWKLLAVRYAVHLAESGKSKEASGYFLCSGESSLLLEHQLRNEPHAARLLSAIGDANGSLPTLPPFDTEEEKRYATLLAAYQGGPACGGSGNGAGSGSSSFSAAAAQAQSGQPDGQERAPVQVTAAIRSCIDSQSSSFFLEGSPVLAACSLLRIGDVVGAVQLLLRGNELLLALAVVRVLQLQGMDEVYLLAARMAEEYGLHDDALKCLQYLSGAQGSNEITLMASRYPGPANTKEEFYVKVGIRKEDAFRSAAEQHIKDNKQIDALTCLVACGSNERALGLGLDYLREMLSGSSWNLDDLDDLMRPLNSLNLSGAGVSAEQRNQLLVYSYYVGAQHAMNLGYTSIVAYLFDSIHSLISRISSSIPSTSSNSSNSSNASANSASALSFPLTPTFLRLQECSYYQCVDPSRALALSKDILVESNLNPKFKLVANQIKKAVECALAAGSSGSSGIGGSGGAGAKNVILPGCSLLPSGGAQAQAYYSMISNELIVGPKLCIDAQPPSSSSLSATQHVASSDVVSGHISLAEGLMWVACTPYSPNHSGIRLNVYKQ